MTLVPHLRDELVAAARRSSHGRRRRSLRRTPVLLAAVLLAFALAAVALAAAGLIGNGEPLKPAPRTPHDPGSGLGLPSRGAAAALPLRVADPDAGPPWGVRFVKTTRGLGCLEVGRVVDGRLGVLGQDGAFGNDRRFHPLTVDYLRASSVVGPFPCGTLDANGHAFAQVYMRGATASGLVVPTSTQPGCTAGPARRHHGRVIPTCPGRDWRAVTAGMAGPDAVSVTYRTAHGRRTVRTVGEQGAFLIVQRLSAKARNLGSFSPDSAGPVVRITYKDGTSCTARRFQPFSLDCPPVGQAPAPAPPTPAEVNAPIRARIGRGHFGRTVIVTFTARRAVTDASAAYVWTLRFSGSQMNCRGMVFGPALRNVRVGEQVRFSQPTNGCRGAFHGKVEYRYGMTGGGFPGAEGGKALLVGRFTVDAR
jgi:hypothetical protein